MPSAPPRPPGRCCHEDRDPRGPACPDGGAVPAQRPAVRRGHRAAGPAGGDRRRRVGQDHGDGGAGGLAGGDRAGRPPGGARADLHHQGHPRARHPHPRVAAGRRHPAVTRRPDAGGPGGAGRRRGARGAHRLDVQRLRGLAADRARPADRPRARHPGGRRCVALPARGPGHRPSPGPRRAAQRPPQDGDRQPAGPRQRDERAPAHPGRGAGLPAATPPRGGGGTGGRDLQDQGRRRRQGAQHLRPPRGAARAWWSPTAPSSESWG